MNVDILTQKKIDLMEELKALNVLKANHPMEGLQNKLKRLRNSIAEEEARLKYILSLDIKQIQRAADALDCALGNFRYD